MVIWDRYELDAAFETSKAATISQQHAQTFGDQVVKTDENTSTVQRTMDLVMFTFGIQRHRN